MIFIIHNIFFNIKYLRKILLLSLDTKYNAILCLKILLVFQVTDVFGFNIAFEISPRKEALKSCNLEVCNFNGECHATGDRNKPGHM